MERGFLSSGERGVKQKNDNAIDFAANVSASDSGNETITDPKSSGLIFSGATSQKQLRQLVIHKNRSLIRKCHNKTPYELLHNKKSDLSYLHVFGALCYPTNDSDDLGKLQPKSYIGIFVGYAPAKKAFRIYNKRTHMIIETIHVDFDELMAMASEQFGSGPGPQLLTLRTLSSGLVPNPPSSTPYVPPTKNDWDILFQPMFDELLNPPPSVVSPVLTIAAQRLADPTGLPVSTSVDQDEPSSSNPSTLEQEQSPIISQGVEDPKNTALS
ncbi:retrovirus-related pol polyprotein from transposon TNT 1-94 [Tanacetum coccineum]